jgi:phosphate transport system substrate-binding protein
MSQKNETTVLVLAFLITAGILGGGGYWFFSQSGFQPEQPTENTTSGSPSLPSNPSPESTTFTPPPNLPSGTVITIDGSTSMVQINQALKKGFEVQFPGTTVNAYANGSSKGIEALLRGTVDLATSSRYLTEAEKNQGLVEVAVSRDAIAIVVGNNNPFRRGLNQSQVVSIFQGQITDWSAVGGVAGQIRVINRPPISGTHQAFQELVLRGGNFGTSPNITTMERDATTPILQALGTDGISYATYSQVANQRTVRTVAVDGLTPEAPNYPYQRTLFYVYKQPPSPEVQAFLGFLQSPQGQQALIEPSN